MMEDGLRDRAYDNVDWDYNPFADMIDPWPSDSAYRNAKYERALRVERKRLAESEESYCMRATVAVVAEQRRRRRR